VAHIHDIHDYARQHLKLASDRMKTQYDKLANSAGYHEGDWVWLFRPNGTKEKFVQMVRKKNLQNFNQHGKAHTK
jgi:hypothetical protein